MNVTETALADLRQQLATVELDDRDRIVEVGASTTLAFDIDPSTAIGRPFDDVFPPRDNLDAAAEVRAVAAPNGGVPRHHVQVTSVRAERPGHRLVLLFDVTSMVRARTECINLTRLASAGRLVSGIVHEINNPLSGIIGYTQLLLMRELERDVRSAIEKVYQEALRTNRIVQNLLDFARGRESGPGTRERLASILRRAIELKSHHLRIHNVSVHLDIPDSLPAIHGDKHQLLQVLVNLISNSEQAMYESDRGGRLSFEARAARQSVTLIIRDTGPGIPENLRDRVFDEFFTTKVEGQGTGLGLALCRDMLRQQGSTIQLLESDTGAAFLLTFRVYQGSPGVSERARQRRRNVRVRGKRLVVVEDDPVVRSLVVEAFERHGNTISAFDRSEPALEYLKTHFVDAIISDLHRPGLNGLQFHHEVHRFDAALARRILFLTGDTLNEELAEFLRRHGNPYLPKPVSLRDLFDTVHRVLSQTGHRQTMLFVDDQEREGGANGLP